MPSFLLLFSFQVCSSTGDLTFILCLTFLIVCSFAGFSWSFLLVSQMFCIKLSSERMEMLHLPGASKQNINSCLRQCCMFHIFTQNNNFTLAAPLKAISLRQIWHLSSRKAQSYNTKKMHSTVVLNINKFSILRVHKAPVSGHMGIVHCYPGVPRWVDGEWNQRKLWEGELK